jgi:small nuclear ribonucleoprotein (snRNP)-like protein
MVFVTQGTMKGYDQAINVVLENCHERVYAVDAGVEQLVLGLYIVRGDNMYVGPSLSLHPRPWLRKA